MNRWYAESGSERGRGILRNSEAGDRILKQLEEHLAGNMQGREGAMGSISTKELKLTDKIDVEFLESIEK